MRATARRSSQTAVSQAVTFVAEAPLPGQGDMEANPNPDPSAIRTMVAAAATVAPAKIAGQDTADTDDSPARAVPGMTAVRSFSSGSMTIPVRSSSSVGGCNGLRAEWFRQGSPAGATLAARRRWIARRVGNEVGSGCWTAKDA